MGTTAWLTGMHASLLFTLKKTRERRTTGSESYRLLASAEDTFLEVRRVCCSRISAAEAGLSSVAAAHTTGLCNVDQQRAAFTAVLATRPTSSTTSLNGPLLWTGNSEVGVSAGEHNNKRTWSLPVQIWHSS